MVEASAPTAPLLDGRYLLEEPVGKGGMATVYRAQDIHLGRTVAVKMIRDEDAVADAADRAHTEKALLASVSHPSLVTLFDAKLDPGRPQYLVMEFVHGPTLATRMASGPLAPHEVAQIARDLAEALAAAHATGIVHRDVKPSNVLLAPPRHGGRWIAKLADFGIACSMDSPRVTTPGLMMGTLAYMAPEQLRDADPTPAVDVFSLGLVLLEALTGEHGYHGGGVASAVARLQAAPSIPDSVAPEWRRLLERMTRLDPGERPSSREVADAVRDLPQKTAGTRRAVHVAAPAAVLEPSAAPNGGSDAETETTKVVPAASAPARRPRARRALWAASAALVAGTLAVGASVMVPGGSDVARAGATTLVRPSAAPVSEPTSEPVDAATPTVPTGTQPQPVEPDVAPEAENGPSTSRSEEASSQQGPPSFSNGKKDPKPKDEKSSGKTVAH
ncbi:protein kinase domain-containing protein [Microbacterium sp. 179-I 3D4 NHS]|uniref:serine/threonine-protein kinase n=1 Tax=Microbacterium sp. 179-I 3D4 NHS TaxID=3142381 RepID=UPI0039A3682E